MEAAAAHEHVLGREAFQRHESSDLIVLVTA
jgi:hypothetical protein